MVRGHFPHLFCLLNVAFCFFDGGIWGGVGTRGGTGGGVGTRRFFWPAFLYFEYGNVDDVFSLILIRYSVANGSKRKLTILFVFLNCCFISLGDAPTLDHFVSATCFISFPLALLEFCFFSGAWLPARARAARRGTRRGTPRTSPSVCPTSGPSLSSWSNLE